MRYISLLENVSLEAMDRFNKISTVLFFGLIITLFCYGCTRPPAMPETSEQKESRLQEYGTDNFPEAAQKVIDLGNGWYSFELRTDGVTRKFLFHRQGDYHGDGQWAYESITEISPAPLP